MQQRNLTGIASIPIHDNTKLCIYTHTGAWRAGKYNYSIMGMVTAVRAGMYDCIATRAMDMKLTSAT